MHVKVKQVCCTFIKEKQAQVLLGSTLTLALHVVGTPAGHQVGLECDSSRGWPGFQSGMGPGSAL